jgi:hypothetical protein
MRNNTQPTLETIQQFRDCNADLWVVQLYYPNGKAKGNDRYWIGTIAKVGTTKTITCSSMLQLDREVARLRQATLAL